MSATDETLLTVSADDAEPSAVVDDNIPTDDVMPPTPDEESKEVLSDDDCSRSPQEIMMISEDAENKEKSATEEVGAESVVKTTTLSNQRVSNEISLDDEEEMKDEKNQVEVQSQSEDMSTEVDTSRAEKDAAINEERQEETEVVEEKTADAEGCVDDTFVSVELSSSPAKNENSSNEEVGGQQEEQQPLMMDAAPVSNTTTAAAVLINPSSEVAETHAAVMVPSNDNVEVAASKLSLNISQPPSTTTTKTTRRRKILHHPIISHIATKLPWDRLSNAGSACDILFNCKYSMKQVEDEVREECRRGVSGEGVYIEDDRVGREDGYVNVSLNSCSDYQYQEEGCEAQEFEEILGCCSMLDNEEDSDDEDVECVVPENSVASQKAPHLDQPMIGLDGSHAVLDTNEEGGDEEEREYSGDNRVTSDNNELQQQQQSEKSWKQSNPSLDMMLYRQFLNE